MLSRFLHTLLSSFFFQRFLRGLGGAFILILVLITALTIIYRFSFVHPISNLMLADKATFTPYQRKWVALDDIAPELIYSVMVSEDSHFCNHNGIDWPSLKYATFTGDEANPLGASTITMQTVKNLYLWNTRSYIRKAIEIPLALWIDLLLPKKRIMEIYLNIAQWGDNIYGIEAASQHYFGIPAKRLNQRQSAVLATLLPSPLTRTPKTLSLRLLAHASIIEQRARASGPYTACLR